MGLEEHGTTRDGRQTLLTATLNILAPLQLSTATALLFSDTLCAKLKATLSVIVKQQN